MKKTLAALAMAAMTVGMLSAGAAADDDTSLNIAIQADVTTMDPQASMAGNDLSYYRMVYDPVVRESDNGIVGVVAKEWGMDDETCMTATITIRDDLTFSDGSKLTASDVAFSMNRALTMAAAQAVPGLKEAKALDDTRVQVEFVSPNPGFFSSLVTLFVVSEEAVTNAGDSYGALSNDLSTFVGSGAYEMVSHETGTKTVFAARDDYSREMPSFTDVEFDVIGDMNTAFLAVTNGDIDFCGMVLPSVTTAQGEATEGLTATYFSSRALCYTGFNCALAPFDKPEVRQAVSIALDRQAIVDLAEDGAGYCTGNIWNELTFGHSDAIETPVQDVEKAKELLAAAGYPDGFEVTLTTIDGSWKKVAEAIQEQLYAIGIMVNIELTDATSIVGNLMKGEYGMQVLSIGFGPDASTWSAVLCENAPLNMFFYTDKRIDDAFAAANTIKEEDRLAAFKTIAECVAEDNQIVPLYFQKLAFVHDDKLNIGFVDGTAQFFVADFTY